jgi:apolipoprotein N-acyltransferase
MSIDPQPLESESKSKRESFWSIDEKDRLNFSFWFSLIFLVGFGLLCWYHICHKNNGFTLTAWVKIAEVFVPTGLVAFTLTFVGFEIREARGRVKIALVSYRKWKSEKKKKKEILKRLRGQPEKIDQILEMIKNKT